MELQKENYMLFKKNILIMGFCIYLFIFGRLHIRNYIMVYN